jgi:hypothetical protein
MLAALSRALGFSYSFNDLPEPLAQQTAQRAGFRLFQTYPANSVEGHGTLTFHNQWSIQQPPQVFVNHTAVIDSLLGSGTEAGTFYGQELSPNPDSTGLS